MARVALKRIRCLSALPIDTVCGWPEVSEVRRENECLHITAVEAEAVVRRLLAVDPHLCELEVQRAGLAEAFTELTRDADEAADTDQREAA